MVLFRDEKEVDELHKLFYEFALEVKADGDFDEMFFVETNGR